MTRARTTAASTATTDAPQASASRRFPEWVAERQTQDGTRRKGERTRDRIRLATVQLLDEVGYRDLTVAEICARADVTAPVLYLYFENKQALMTDVLREFLDDFLARGEVATAATAFESIHSANRTWIALARENAGLMRCLLQLSDDVPEFAALFANASDAWYRRIARNVVRRFPSAATEEAGIHLIAHAMGAMMDEVTRKLFSGNDPHLQALVATVAPTDDDLARFLSLIWHRALYAADPEPGAAPPVAPRLAAAARRAARRAP
ncbi:MAG: TetR/AcrR family transcriptional regulator [Gemmatimonadaceae bacterium]|nr:TetR/AcrR family transcriptional regulator [Gemmatimonadaceae bacterium]